MFLHPRRPPPLKNKLFPVTKENTEMEAENSVAFPWKLLFVLSLAGLFTSVSFNISLIKQNNKFKADWTQLDAQIQDLQQKENIVNSLFKDIGEFGIQHPDIRSILSKYGINMNLELAPPPPLSPPAGTSLTQPPPVPKPSVR